MCPVQSRAHPCIQPKVKCLHGNYYDVEGLKFYCYKCGSEYTQEERNRNHWCTCGAFRYKVQLEKTYEKVPEEIKDYILQIFDAKQGTDPDLTEHQMIYEKAFTFLALIRFMCGRESDRIDDFTAFYEKNRAKIARTYSKIVREFKRQSFVIPTIIMPGVLEKEVFGSESNSSTISGLENVRAKLMSLTPEECEQCIRFLEVRLKTRLLNGFQR